LDVERWAFLPFFFLTINHPNVGGASVSRLALNSQLSTINFCRPGSSHAAAINIIRRASIFFATLNR